MEQILNIYAIRAIILLPMLIVKQKRKSDEWRHRTESDGCHGAELEKGKWVEDFKHSAKIQYRTYYWLKKIPRVCKYKKEYTYDKKKPDSFTS